MSGASRTLTRIRLVAHQAKGSTRTPFVVLVVGLLGGGLLCLLLLNTALNQGSFEVGKLQNREDDLIDEREALQRELDARSVPAELARRAEEMGMVPGGAPAFIDPATGQVLGDPEPAPSRSPVAPTPSTVPVAPTTPPVAPAQGRGPGPSVSAAPGAPAGVTPGAARLPSGARPSPSAPATTGPTASTAKPAAPTPKASATTTPGPAR